MSYGPEEKKNSGGTEQSRHRVDHQSDFGDIATGKIDKETGCEHENGVARRVTDFKLECLQNKLGTVPEACGGFDSKQVANSRNHEAKPTKTIVDEVVSFHVVTG